MSHFTAFWEPLTTKPIAEKNAYGPDGSFGVHDNGQAPCQGPRGPTSPHCPCPACPWESGSQVPSQLVSSSTQLCLFQPQPMSWCPGPAWPHSVPVLKEATDAWGWAAPSCPAPWLGWRETCCPVVPHAPVLRTDPDQLKAMHFPIRWANMPFFPAHLQTSGILVAEFQEGQAEDLGLLVVMFSSNKGSHGSYAVLFVYLRLNWIHKNNFTN